MMIKIIHVANDLNLGGVSSLLYDLLKNHQSSQFKYEIINLSGKGNLEVIERFNSSGLKIHNLNYKFDNGFSMLDQYNKAFLTSKTKLRNQEIIHYISSLNPNILHFHTLPAELLLGKQVLRQHKCELVYTDHSTRLKKSEIKRLSRFLIRPPFIQFYKNFHVIAVSNAVENYIKSFGIHKVVKSLTVIKNKIPPSNSRVEYKSKDILNAVYVSRIFNGKGHSELIEAWAKLGLENVHLHIVGPDSLNGLIQSKVKELKLTHCITFTGSINNVNEFLLNMDIGLFPSHKEGLPLALLEKMQVGLPCIVSDIEELTNIIQDGFNGLVFKKGDAQDLADKISALIRNPELRAKLGKNAAENINSNYVSKLGGIDKEYEAFYKKLCLG